MTTNEAIEILRKVAALYVGNLKDHETIQSALKVLSDATAPVAPVDPAPKE